MSTNFHTEIENGNVSLRFWFYIQGIPFIFLDGALPVGSDGTAFQSTVNNTSLHHQTYPANSAWVVKENTFDLSKGLESIGADISRRTGVTSPGQMNLTLRDEGNNFLIELFARSLETAETTEMNANLTRAGAAGASTEIFVDDNSSFDSSGLLYVGRETIHYSGKAGSAGVDARFTGLTRNICALSNHDVYYDQEDYKASAPRSVSDNPRSWAGRYVRVFAFLVDEFGRALNRGNPAGWNNNEGYQLEIFRGMIAHNPRPLANWTQYKIAVKGLEVLLDQEIGGNFPEGSLINAPGNKKWNEKGFIDPNNDFEVFDENVPAVIMQSGSNRVHMLIKKYAGYDEMDSDAPQDSDDFTGVNSLEVSASGKMWSLSAIDSDLVGAVGTLGNLMNAVLTAINSGIQAAGWGEYIHATGSAGVGKGEIHISFNEDPPAYAAFRFIFYWGAGDSVSQLFGVTETQSLEITNSAGNLTKKAVAMWSPTGKVNEAVIGMVTKSATQIIYWLKSQPDGGAQVEPVSTNGYALIGGKEVIKYAADVDVAATLGATAALYFEGMRVLKGVERGIFDTERMQHTITVDDAAKITSEAVDIKFGYGADEDSWSDAFLKLAHSTGTANNNGSFDTNAKETGAAISSAHFDLVAFNDYAETAGDNLDRQIRYFSSKTSNLKRWIEDFLQPRMCYISAANHGYHNYEFLLSLVQIRPALESEYVVTITADDVDFSDPATFQAGNSRICNRVRCFYRWDFAEERETQDQVIATDWDSAQDNSGIRSVTWRLKGQQWSYDQAYARISMWALRAFQRFGHDYDVLNIKVNRKGLQVAPGDTVKLTLAGAPTNEGIRGFESALGVCIRADHTWHEPRGTPTSVLTIVIESQVRQSIYCPSAVVRAAATIDGSPALLLEDNEYTATGSGTYFDATHFTAGDHVVVHNAGDYSTRDLRRIESFTTGTDDGDTLQAIVLDGALTNATAGGLNPAIVTFQNYNIASATQREHTFVASDANVLSVSNTESFKYV